MNLRAYYTPCPLEYRVKQALDNAGLRYTRPEKGAGRLDFYVTDWDVFVEVKNWMTDRLPGQVTNTPRADGRVIILVGMPAVEVFAQLIEGKAR